MGFLLEILHSIGEAIYFWMAWIIIPFIMEVIPAIGGFVILVRKKFGISRVMTVEGRYPEISLIIPVYNSSETLYDCLRSL